jgi:Cu-Zn family superoxide dismutase
MTRFTTALSILALSAATACAQEAEPANQAETLLEDGQEAMSGVVDQAEAVIADARGDGPSEARATLIDRNREAVGEARFEQGPTGVLITIEMDGLPDTATGWHGGHIHSIGDCSNADFTSSGGHINPSSNPHGLLNADGPDNADLANTYVHSDGTMRAQVFTTRVSLDGRMGVPSVFDEDGSAIVFHDNQDDHVSQPIGGAGARHVCGVIEMAGQ